MKRLWLSLVLMSSASFNASAVEWVTLAESNSDDTVVYLDADSVQPYTKNIPLSNTTSNYISGFAQFTYLRNHSALKRGWYYTKYFFIVNCDDNSYYMPTYNVYDVNDHVVTRFNNKHFSANDFNVAFPETLGSYVVSEICFLSA